jgi:hypothetical protein
MTEIASTDNISKNAHTHTHEFLEQIAITDKKKQKKFFSNHSLNFFNLAQNNKNRKKRKVMGIVNTIYSLVFLTMMGNLFIDQSQREVKHLLWQNNFDSTWHADTINMNIRQSISVQEGILLDDIDNLIEHPAQDEQGHRYVPEALLQAKLSAFYKSSILHDYGNLTKFEVLGFSLDSPFVSSQIKKTFAEQEMKAMQTDFRMSMQEDVTTLKNRSAYSLSRLYSDASYMDMGKQEYYEHYKSHYALLKQIYHSKDYRYSRYSKNSDSSEVEKQTLYNSVSTEEFIQALQTGVIGDN